MSIECYASTALMGRCNISDSLLSFRGTIFTYIRVYNERENNNTETNSSVNISSEIQYMYQKSF